MITYLDWREVPVDIVRPLYNAECERWERALGWNYRPWCATLESARCGRRLPGLLARTAKGEVVGWSYYMLHAGRLHIGGLVAADRAVVRGLLGGMLRSADARMADSVSCFLYPLAAGLESALGRARFELTRHRYLRCPVAPPPHRSDDGCVGRGSSGHYRLTAWTRDRVADVARLFASAYEGMPESRCFTSANRVDEWLTYLAHIESGAVCGESKPSLSAIIQTPDNAVAGAIIGTELAPGVAHVAQLAVAPAHRRRHLAQYLVQWLRAESAARGYHCLTLLVADTNDAARRIYRAQGFEEVDDFVFGYRKARGE